MSLRPRAASTPPRGRRSRLEQVLAAGLARLSLHPADVGMRPPEGTRRRAAQGPRPSLSPEDEAELAQMNLNAEELLGLSPEELDDQLRGQAEALEDDDDAEQRDAWPMMEVEVETAVAELDEEMAEEDAKDLERKLRQGFKAMEKGEGELPDDRKLAYNKTPEQNAALEALYAEDTSANARRLRAIAEQLNLTAQQVRDWFRWRRFNDPNKSPPTPGKAKKPRTKFTRAQTDALMEYFTTESPNPKAPQVAMLAEQNDLTEQQVIDWFQRTRKARRESELAELVAGA
jgi:hypothetical protein